MNAQQSIPETRTDNITFTGPNAQLKRLRFKAMRCRASAFLDVYGACRLLNLDEERRQDSFEDMLLRVLPEALGEHPTFYHLNADNLSFDENWLLSALNAVCSKDYLSLEFLIRSRVDQRYQRSVRYLLTGAVNL